MVSAGQAATRSFGRGLTITVSTTGAASWVLRYSFEGRRRELTLGRWPDLSFDDAQAAAATARRGMEGAKPVDPASAKKKARAAAPAIRTMRELADDYARVRLPQLAPSTEAEYKGVIRRHVYPALGSLAPKDITPSTLVGVIRKRTKTTRPAEQLKSVLVGIFEHGMGLSVVDANPARGVSVAAIHGRHETRKRVTLTADELRTVLHALATVAEPDALAIRILLATGVRKGELFSAQWKDVDLSAGLWTVPDESTKTRSGFTIPIGGHPAVVGWFRRLHALAGPSPWVLPARRSDKLKAGQHVWARGINVVLEELCDRLEPRGVRRFTPHDLRATMRGHFSRMKVPHAVSERALNHKLSKLIEVYDGHDYLDERRDALGAWVGFLVELDPLTRHPGVLRAA